MIPREQEAMDRSEVFPSEFETTLGQAVAHRIGEARYRLWFEGSTKFVLLGDGLAVGVPNLHFQEWLQTTFGTAVREAVADVVGKPVPVRFVIDPDLFRAARAAQEEEAKRNRADAQPAPQESKQTPSGESTPELLDHQPSTSKRRKSHAAKAMKPARRWRHLSDFVMGACNRVALASAQSVIEEPGQGANPLVLYGPVGTGKTHLLEGIYVGLRKHWPDERVVFTTAEEFTNRFVQGMRLNRMASFRRTFRECSALLLDDLNFLTTKRATQEEFLHTFDVLVSDGCQVVVTCDCHPRLADELMPELADRLIGGAVWSLLPPDAETRLAILRAKASRTAPMIGDEVLQYLAGQLRGNVRELEGALHSVRHFSRVTGRPIDLALAREALGDLLRHAVRVVRVQDVDDGVCVVLRLKPGTLQSKQRAWAVSHPRMIAIYLSRKHTAATYGEISRHFGNKTHSTAVAAEKKVRQWIREDQPLALGGREWRARDLIERIERELMS